MAISRTVNGLQAEIFCDSYESEEWEWYATGPIGIVDDTVDKKEGEAAQLVQGQHAPGTATGGWRKNNVPMTNGSRVHCWAKHTRESGDSSTKQLKIDESDTPLFSTTGEAWAFKQATVPDVIGEKAYTTGLKHHFVNFSNVKSWLDHIVITRNQYVKFTGLTPGQKVELFRASDSVELGEATCAGGQTSVQIDVDAEEYPEYMYAKVYATDSITLIEITPNYLMQGGDEWYWVSPYGTLTIESDAFIIVRSQGTGSPKEAHITATLKTQAGNPAPGKTIYFTTSRGTVDPTSDVTDANGQVTTTLTATTHGIAVVKANWPGDADIPAAVNWAVHHVFYNAEAGDDEKKFQFFIEGVEYSYAKGRYSISHETTPQEWSVEIPEWLSTITRRGLVGIYRKGVKEFSGVLTKLDRTLSESPNVVLSGTDSKALLETRVVTLKDYSAETLEYVLDDLLDSYPCGVTLGTVGAYPSPLTITFADETLVSTVSRLCDVLGWLYRVNADNTLDAKLSFGSSKPGISFIEGVNLFIAGNSEDYTGVCNSLRMRGKDTFVSTQYDASSIEALGIIEDVAFQKSIEAQATLDIAAVAELARRVDVAVKISASVIDEYDVGAWAVDDWVTLTCAHVELSGLYKIVRIERDMTDPNYAAVDFSNRAAAELADVLDRLKRELKDLSAKAL